jgi:phage anti-repressor protein
MTLPGQLVVPPSNLIGFSLVEALEKDGYYFIICEVKDGIFSQNKRRYTVKLDLSGELKEVKRDESKTIPV